LSGIKRI